MEPISRRALLAMGGLGLVSTAVGAGGVWREMNPALLAAVSGSPLAEPAVVSSTEGVLELRLEAALGEHQVAGRRVRTLGYNGGVPGPTLRLTPGDSLRLDLVNRLEETTNLHVHGLHVSPEGNGDNVFLAVEPGRTHRYEYRLPDDHQPGVHWYHPHHHGSVADQVFGGLYGAIVVEDPDDDIGARRDRVMVISDITLDGDGSLVSPSTMEQMMGREGELVLLNGQRAPRLETRAGTRERWRIVNACTSRYLALELAGQDPRVVGRDGGRLAQDVALADVVLAPGNRLDVVVDPQEGSSDLVARPVDRGSAMGGMMGGVPTHGGEQPVALARVEAGPGPAPARASLALAAGIRDLRNTPVEGRRSIRMSMPMAGMMGGGGDGPMAFTLDGLRFDAYRLDQRVRLGAVEEWTITNDSPLDHPFHLHVWPMQLISVDGRSVPEPLWLDVVNVPARGRATVRVAFEDFAGKTVYHCHILDHEDRGMMGTIAVQ